MKTIIVLNTLDVSVCQRLGVGEERKLDTVCERLCVRERKRERERKRGKERGKIEEEREER